MAFSPRQVKFSYAKSETLPRYCRDRSYLKDCHGKCPKNRLIRTPDGEPGLKKIYKRAPPGPVEAETARLIRLVAINVRSKAERHYSILWMRADGG
jgi:sulfatase maturation enzyme AslB (radical SAM superfamily)